MTPKQMALQVHYYGLRLRREVDRELEHLGSMGVKEAKVSSSGPYSLAQLRRMGHPYSRRRPRPPLDPGVINRQTGRFLRAWGKSSAYWDAGKRTVNVANFSDRAVFMRGTKRMIARPIWRQIIRRVEPHATSRLKLAAARAQLTG